MKFEIIGTKSNVLNNLVSINNILGNSVITEEPLENTMITGLAGDNFVTCIALDGFRIAKVRVSVKEALSENFKIYLHKDILKEITKTIRSNEFGVLKFDINKDSITIELPGIWNTTIDNKEIKFFNYKEFVKDEYENYIGFNAFEFRKVLKELLKYNKVATDGIDFDLDENGDYLLISSRDKEKHYSIKLEDNNHPKLKTRRYNPSYLLNTLKNVKKNDICQLTFCDYSKDIEPLDLKVNGNEHWLLPIRINC